VRWRSKALRKGVGSRLQALCSKAHRTKAPKSGSLEEGTGSRPAGSMKSAVSYPAHEACGKTAAAKMLFMFSVWPDSLCCLNPQFLRGPFLAMYTLHTLRVAFIAYVARIVLNKHQTQKEEDRATNWSDPFLRATILVDSSQAHEDDSSPWSSVGHCKDDPRHTRDTWQSPPHDTRPSATRFYTHEIEITNKENRFTHFWYCSKQHQFMVYCLFIFILWILYFNSPVSAIHLDIIQSAQCSVYCL